MSLAAITEAAHASNASAIQYHFGSKDGLLEAIVDEYEKRAEARRAELATALADRGEFTLRDEVET
ncbi:MAG: TetR/AcrR family transcriptional regulator, partial [Candidatus Binatia bacterium]